MNNEWTATEMQLLTEQWAAGIPSAAIGAQINRSRGAVTSKARHMGLTARPSPIVRNIDRMADLLADGMRVDEAAKVMRISYVEGKRLFGQICHGLGWQAI